MQVRRHWATTQIFSSDWVWPFRDTANLGKPRAGHRSLKRNAAPGVDGVTWEAYGGEQLDERLADLFARVHRGAYRALPSRRKMIPKPDGRERPLGIASLEDKIVQRAMVEILNEIYEADFLGFCVSRRELQS
jgi:RNA-directed DNA polymerase